MTRRLWPSWRRRIELGSDDACLLRLFDVYEGLKALGWKDIIYCPKNGAVFRSISVGSTGIHDCHYQGEWPDGSLVVDGGPACPILFKLKDPPIVEGGVPRRRVAR